jgi:hypothetical protein
LEGAIWTEHSDQSEWGLEEPQGGPTRPLALSQATTINSTISLGK